MKAFFVVFALIGALTVANAQILTAAAIIIGAKILIGKGFIVGAVKGGIVGNLANGRGGSRGGHGHGSGYGSSSRYGRDVGDLNTVLLEQNAKDVDQCFKLLVCHLNSKPVNKLDEEEFAIATTFGQTDVIDVTQPSVLYDVAALVGRKAGEKQCKVLYPRCATQADSIMAEIKKAVQGN